MKLERIITIVLGLGLVTSLFTWLTDSYYQYCWIYSIIIYILNYYGINFKINFIFIEFKYKKVSANFYCYYR